MKPPKTAGIDSGLTNAFLAARLMNADHESLMRAAWIGEIGKLLMAALLFGMIFAFVRPLSIPAVFAGFMVTHFAILPTLFVLQRSGEKRTS